MKFLDGKHHKKFCQGFSVSDGLSFGQIVSFSQQRKRESLRGDAKNKACMDCACEDAVTLN